MNTDKLSERKLFAAIIMAGWRASEVGIDSLTLQPKDLASFAVEDVDALLAELEK